MMPKSAGRFSDDIMLQVVEIAPVHEFGPVRFELSVI